MIVLFGKKVNAILRWKPSDKKVFVGYLFPYSQKPVGSDDLKTEDQLIQKIETFCKSNNFTPIMV